MFKEKFPLKRQGWKLVLFYGDLTLQNLLKHCRTMTDELRTFERIYSLTTEKISNDCFKYIFTDKNKKLIFWVNWSEDIVSDRIPNGNWIKKEYYTLF